MENIDAITTLITTLGFPIVCVLGLGWFIFKIYNDTTKANEENMAKVQERCAEREEKLYDEIKANREVNAQAVATIALYAEKLGVIQSDVADIKTDVAVLMNRQ